MLFCLVVVGLCLARAVVQTPPGALRRLTVTPEQALNLNPTLSGDGRHVAFESTADVAATGRAAGFHALRADLADDAAPGIAQFAPTRAPAPAVTQDGTRIAFAATADPLPGTNLDGNAEIFWHDGTQLQQLTQTTPADPALRAQQGNFAPTISADGRFVAFHSNRDLTGANTDGNLEIFLYDTTRRVFRQVTDTAGTVGASEAKLSGDGTRVCYINDRRATAADESNARDLVLYDLQTGTTRTVAADVPGLSLTPGRAVSADGTRIVYAARTATNTTQVFLYDERNNVVRQLTTLGARVTDVPLAATISGDGARITFATRRNVTGGPTDGSVELYLYDLPTNRFTRLTDAPATATAEVISSLDHTGALVAFSFPRVLSGPVAAPETANNPELYALGLAARAPFAADLQITHGATFGREPATLKAVAPDQIAVATGRNLALKATQPQRQADGTFPRSATGTSLTVNGRAAELLYVAPTQINFVVPTATEPGAATFIVRNHDGYETRGTVQVLSAAPGIFTERGDGTGAAVALEATTHLRAPFDPADDNDTPRRLSVYTTGTRHATNVSVVIAGQTLPVEARVPVPDLPGLDELYIVLPLTLRGAGVVSLTVNADGRASNPTTIQFSGQRRAASLTLTPATADIGVGRSVHFRATVLDATGAQIPDAPVTYTTDAPDVATVTADGTTRALAPGTTNVRAVSGAASATAQLQVHPLALVINEVLADPPDGPAGDANHDGTRSAAQDEFVELVNAAAFDLDIGNYQLLTRNSAGTDVLRHTFAPGTTVAPGTAIVVFGGAQAGTFNPADPVFGGAQVVLAASGGLSLLNGGSTVTLRAAGGAVVEEMTYGAAPNPPGDRAQALTRAPDITGDFALHQQTTGSNGRAFSPGTRADGTPFNPAAPIARITLDPSAATIEVDGLQQFVARAYAADGRELSGVIFQWQTSAPAVATVDPRGLARALAPGVCEISATARGVRAAPALLTVRETPPVLTRIEVTPAATTLPLGVQQQFDARGFDQRGRELSGLTFTWASAEPAIADITQTGLVTTRAPGSTFITATAQAVAGTTTLQVVAPALVINEVLADPPDGPAGDANHDGTRSGTDDEFVELVNPTGGSLDLGGWTLRTRPHTSATETTRHTFAPGTTLPAGDALVVFGGGAFVPDDPVFGGAQTIRAAAGGLALTNSGLVIIVRDATGRAAAQFAYGTADDDFGGDSVNQAITRAPDGTGAYVRHTLAPGADARKFSPGTKLDGAFFAPRTGLLTRVPLAPTSASINVGGAAQFTAQARDQYDRPLPHVAFAFNVDNPAVAVVTAVTTDDAAGRAVATITGLRVGAASLTATATAGPRTATSNAATLQILLPPPVVRRVEVAPAPVQINRGQNVQFSARAFDQNEQLVPAAAFTWTTTDAQVAAVTIDGLARGLAPGMVAVVATTPDGAGGTVSGQALLTVRVPLVINELLADVPPDNASTLNVEGDANRDGVRSADDDEFIELLNNSDAPLDVSGLVIADATSNRFTCPAGTTLAAGRSLVVFGGGTPPVTAPAFGGALILTTTSLGLNDGGDTVTVKLPTSGGDIIIATQSYGSAAPGAPPAPNDQALTRAPDAEIGSGGGNFRAHLDADGATGRVFSPGTRADGTPFGAPPLTRIEVVPVSAQIELGARQSFMARAYSGAGASETEVTHVSFIWDVADATRATLSPTTGPDSFAIALAAGTTTVRAQAGGQQAAATLTVNPPPAVLTRIALTPAGAALTVGATLQFRARGFDQNEQEITGLTFTWATSTPAVATVNDSGLATGISAGTTHITAAAGTVTSAPALLDVSVPPVAAAGQVIINEALVSFSTSATQTRADFIELFNVTNQPLDISGLVITFRPTGSGNTPAASTLPGSVGSRTTLIAARSYFLIVNGADTFGVGADFNAQPGGFDLNNTTGGIKLELNGVKLDGLAYQGGTTPPATPFDTFGTGALLSFTSGTTNDLIRSPDATDTNNNATDFRRNGATASVTPKAPNP